MGRHGAPRLAAPAAAVRAALLPQLGHRQALNLECPKPLTLARRTTDVASETLTPCRLPYSPNNTCQVVIPVSGIPGRKRAQGCPCDVCRLV